MVDYKQIIIVYFIHNIWKGNLLAAGQIDSDTFRSYGTPTLSVFFLLVWRCVPHNEGGNSLRVFENRVLGKTIALSDGRGNTGVEKTT